MMAVTMTIEMKMTRTHYQDPCPKHSQIVILHPWGVFLSVEKSLLLFCNRVCLLTAGDCLSPMLSALTNQLENIPRQDERVKLESESESNISGKH